MVGASRSNCLVWCIREPANLQLWAWDDIEKAVYLDADTLALQNIDDMFLAPAFLAVLDNMSADEDFTPERFETPNVRARSAGKLKKRAYFNAGVFIFEPSKSELDEMRAALAHWTPSRFAEQDFLNHW